MKSMGYSMTPHLYIPFLDVYRSNFTDAVYGDARSSDRRMMLALDAVLDAIWHYMTRKSQKVSDDASSIEFDSDLDVWVTSIPDWVFNVTYSMCRRGEVIKLSPVCIVCDSFIYEQSVQKSLIGLFAQSEIGRVS